MLAALAKSIFGSANDRYVRSMFPDDVTVEIHIKSKKDLL